jgi:hypothetical protein
MLAALKLGMPCPQGQPGDTNRSRLEVAALLLRLDEAFGLPILAGRGPGRRDWGLLGLVLGHG